MFIKRSSDLSLTKRLTKKHWVIICLVCTLAAVGVVLIMTVQQNDGDTAVYQEIRQNVAPVVVAPVVPDPKPIELPEPEMVNNGVHHSDRTIDFEALFEKNQDIIAWISVPGTEIDYPVLRSQDNTDYLTHDATGKYNGAGAIFMDKANSPDFTDRNTVIYGHNMNNGSMFAGLHQFQKSDFFEQNREIKLYTPDGMRVYEIFGAYVADDNNILYHNNFSDDEVWKAYIENIFHNTDLSANILQKQIGADDQIITLSTCVHNQKTQRYLVQGVLTKDAG